MYTAYPNCIIYIQFCSQYSVSSYGCKFWGRALLRCTSIQWKIRLTQLFQIHRQPGLLYWGGHAAPKSVPLWNTSKKNFSWLSWLTLSQSVGTSEAASTGLFHSFIGYSRHRVDLCWSEATRHGWVSLRNQLSVWQLSQRPGGHWDGAAGVWV